MWIEFVPGSPCTKGFSPRSLVFLPPKKPTFLINSNLIWKQGMRSHSADVPLQISILIITVVVFVVIGIIAVI